MHAVDHVVIAVADLDESTRAYRDLLGREVSWRGQHPGLGTRNALFRLDNTYLELLAAEREGTLAGLVRAALREREERAFALALRTGDLDAAVAVLRARGLTIGDPAEGEGVDERSGSRRRWRSAFVDRGSTRGLQLLLIQHLSSSELLVPAEALGPTDSVVGGVDHVVIFSQDLEAALALWTRVLGVEQRWRTEIPERGTTNVGLELGGVTIELVMRTDTSPTGPSDAFWGIAYRAPSCEAGVERLRRTGLAASDARDGLAPRTRVATVRWSRTPTLLIEHLPRT